MSDPKPVNMLPGGKEAIAQGCTCPREQGRAFMGVYTMSGDCPLHGTLTPDPESENER